MNSVHGDDNNKGKYIKNTVHSDANDTVST